jgi:hypothetical protein
MSADTDLADLNLDAKSNHVKNEQSMNYIFRSTESRKSSNCKLTSPFVSRTQIDTKKAHKIVSPNDFPSSIKQQSRAEEEEAQTTQHRTSSSNGLNQSN